MGPGTVWPNTISRRLNLVMTLIPSLAASNKQAGLSQKIWALNNLNHLIDSCVRNLSTEILKPSEAARTVDNTCSHGCASKTTSFDTTHTPSPSRLQRESTLQPNRNRTAAAPYTDLHTPGAGPAKLKNWWITSQGQLSDHNFKQNSNITFYLPQVSLPENQTVPL